MTTMLLMACKCGNIPVETWAKIRVRDGHRCGESVACREAAQREHEELILKIRERRLAREAAEAERLEAERRREAEKAKKKKADKARLLANRAARAAENKARANGDHLKLTRKVSG